MAVQSAKEADEKGQRVLVLRFNEKLFSTAGTYGGQPVKHLNEGIAAVEATGRWTFHQVLSAGRDEKTLTDRMAFYAVFVRGTPPQAEPWKAHP